MIFTSPHPSVPVPETTITSFALERAQQYADRTAIVDIDGDGAYTYSQLATLARRTAAGLQRRGLGKGDVLAMLAPNVPEYPIVFHAATMAGATVVVLNPVDTIDELAKHLKDAGARFLVTVPAEVSNARALSDRTGVDEIVVIGEAEGATRLASLQAEDVFSEPLIDPERDVAAVLHSSGSTGHPKGVLLTHRNLIANALQTSVVAPLAEAERVLAVPPFHHGFGLNMVLNASLHQAATLVTMSRFDPEAYLKAIEEHRITRLYVVPTIAVLLARSPLVDRYDLGSVREIVSGGAALDPETARQVHERLGCRIGQGYGLTEALVSFMQPHDPATPASVGVTAPNIECKIVDLATGEDLGPDQSGEIVIRGPHVMKGYLNAQEATREVLDADGFIHTGDLGYFDDSGELVIVDRLKELIKYKGQQVSPAELETVVMTHPKVSDAAVIGVPDEEASEVPKAFIVAAAAVTGEEIMAFVAERMAPYKKVRQVEFIDQIPRTPVGKTERRTLRDWRRAA